MNGYSSDAVYTDETLFMSSETMDRFRTAFLYAPENIRKIQEKLNKNGLDSLTEKELTDITVYQLDNESGDIGSIFGMPVVTSNFSNNPFSHVPRFPKDKR